MHRINSANGLLCFNLNYFADSEIVFPLVIDEYLRLPARLYFEERCSSVYVNINGVIRLVPG